MINGKYESFYDLVYSILFEHIEVIILIKDNVLRIEYE